MVSELRKKKNQEKKEYTRQQLLKAAGLVFIQKGYHGTMISNIVNEAGMGQGTFYRHFTDKRDIFEKLLDELVSILLQQFSSYQMNPAENFSEYEERAYQAILAMAREVDKRKELCMMFLREIPVIDQKLEQKLDSLIDAFKNMAKFHLDLAIENKFARPCHSQIVSSSIVGIAIQLMNDWNKGNYSEMTLEDIVKEACNFAFLGLKE